MELIIKLTTGDIKAHETNYYIFKDGALYRNAYAGQFLERTRPTRNAGKYKVYVDSFSDVALPYSKYHIANTESGKVYDAEIVHGIIDNPLGKIVEVLKEM